MKKSISVFISDINHLKVNVIAIIVILGLCVLPSLYAWFNIAACWDPYGNTGDIPVAVVNQDDGNELDGVHVNIGKEIMSTLAGNKQMGWDFVSRSKADNGIKTGKYYAVVVIPDDFSKDMLSIATEDIQRPSIEYYVNEKKNGIAPKITDNCIETIQTEVNKSFIESATKLITDVIGDKADKVKLTENQILGDINTTLNTAETDLEELNTNLSGFCTTIDSIISLMDANTSLLSGAKSTISRTEKTLRVSLEQLKNLEQSIDATTYPDVVVAIKAAERDINNSIGILDDFDGSVDLTKSTLNSLKASLKSTKATIASTQTLISGTINKIENTKDSFAKLNISTNILKIITTMKKNPDKVAEFAASPVEIQTTVIYPVKNYGSAMAPFYTTLAIWVGGIILIAIMKVKVRRDDELGNLTLRQEYLGRSLIFIVMSLVQATILGLGDLLFLGIQCEHPLLFMITCWITAIVFVLIIYTLTVSFGSIGKAICVIWLVIQVAGSGGTFPVEVLPDVFKSWAPFMPFTYSCNAMRECVAGIYASGYMTEIIKLLCFIPFALLLGLVLRNPLYRLNEFFEKRLGDTKFMG